MAWIDCSVKVLDRPDKIVLIVGRGIVRKFGRELVLTLVHFSGSLIFPESIRSWIVFFRVLQVLVVWPDI